MHRNVSGRINALRAQYPDAELRRIFVKRFDDEMFVEIGTGATGLREAKKLTAVELAWIGFENLLGIERLEDEAVEGFKSLYD